MKKEKLNIFRIWFRELNSTQLILYLEQSNLLLDSEDFFATTFWNDAQQLRELLILEMIERLKQTLPEEDR